MPLPQAIRKGTGNHAADYGNSTADDGIAAAASGGAEGACRAGGFAG